MPIVRRGLDVARGSALTDGERLSHRGATQDEASLKRPGGRIAKTLSAGCASWGRASMQLVFLIVDKMSFMNKMRNIMPAHSPAVATTAVDSLVRLGQQIRARRKSLRVNATATAEAAGMSRVTLHRIEHGEPSVTMGAYVNAMAALGLEFGILSPSTPAADTTEDIREGWIPARIRLADYPQLKQLAWQVHGTDTLTPVEALGIYERNSRHLDLQTLELREQHLIEALRLALGDGRGDV